VINQQDYGGSIQAQIDRTYSGEDEYWSTPSTNYSTVFSLPDNGVLQIIVCDTTTLAPSETGATSRVSSSIQKARIDNQVGNLKRIFEYSKFVIRPNWLIVVGHYCPYSIGNIYDIT
jgi:hypothetical protein